VFRENLGIPSVRMQVEGLAESLLISYLNRWEMSEIEHVEVSVLPQWLFLTGLARGAVYGHNLQTWADLLDKVLSQRRTILRKFQERQKDGRQEAP